MPAPGDPSTAPPPLRFTGHDALPTRLLLSTLTGRSIHISQIRSKSRSAPGLQSYEISLLRLLTSLTNGTHVEVSMTGTSLLYRPGLIIGTPPGYGADGSGVLRLDIEAPPSTERRGISYWALPVCLLAPFAKSPVNVILGGPGVITGATEKDISIDTVRTGVLPLFERFGIRGDVEIRVLKRACRGGVGGGGGGEVQIVFGKIAQVRLPKTVHMMVPGRVRRVRGVAYGVGIGGGSNARMIEVARGILNPLCPDTYVYSDVASAPFLGGGNQQGKGGGKRTGLGFGLSLVAETSSGALYSADCASPSEGGETPEEVGRKATHQLLEVISQGGCLSKTTAPPFLLLMAMGSEDVGRVCMGKGVIGSEEVIALGRDLRSFGMNAWGMRDADDEDTVIVSVVGKGVGNVGRKVA
ncbi:18S rRNA biogenesis protein [Eremomyces bilateralis CBS 781.70]|uniref:18S rRNA biogenesis protein n=1 Tax=Eremomyces bilateralis CBS 781.70 TaxID=1392243 RepID=A0A6G1FYC6_9PEZI|nr:18S rRNA biogenesis protein [Eremomyces bilateralis CBS 781.70]KAF1810700.1 18S rRNA biogenesis protein [Eremomyces bilateralis CBS 781.70]